MVGKQIDRCIQSPKQKIYIIFLCDSDMDSYVAQNGKQLDWR